MVVECSLSSDFNNTVGSKFTTHLTVGRQPQRTRNSLCWQVYHTSYCGQTATENQKQPLLASLPHILLWADSHREPETASIGKFTTHLTVGRQPQRTRNSLCWQVYHTSYCGQTATENQKQPLLASLPHILLWADSHREPETASIGKFTTHLTVGRQPQRTRNSLCWQVYHTSTLPVQVTYRHVECPANICRYHALTSCALHKLN